MSNLTSVFFSHHEQVYTTVLLDRALALCECGDLDFSLSLIFSNSFLLNSEIALCAVQSSWSNSL